MISAIVIDADKHPNLALLALPLMLAVSLAIWFAIGKAILDFVKENFSTKDPELVPIVVVLVISGFFMWLSLR